LNVTGIVYNCDRGYGRGTSFDLDWQGGSETRGKMKLMRLSSAVGLLQVLSCITIIAVRAEHDSRRDDPMEQCGLFLAESSIPNSGWGVFTGKDIYKDDAIYPLDVAIQTVDRENHMLLRAKLGRKNVPDWKMSDYAWGAEMTSAFNDARKVDSFVPGLGMACNSQPGMANVINRGLQRRQGEGNNGAYTRYQEHIFESTQDIPAGHELFLELHAGASFKSIFGAGDGSVSNPVRSLSWLKENGLCVDHIEPKLSSIESAGMGAFAKRFLPKGTVVAPAPVVPMSKAHLEMIVPLSHQHLLLLMHDRYDHEPFWEGHQLLLNYVYGHPSTSLVFFPYAPIVNMINHNGKEPNAKLQWSSMETSKFDQTPDELLESPVTLLMEVVAIQDILPGEEVVLDYGDEWQKAWDTHDHIEPSSDFVSAWMFEQESLFRTEADGNSYPSYIELFCGINFDRATGVKQESKDGLDHILYEWRVTKTVGLQKAVRCYLVESNSSQIFSNEMGYKVRLEREGNRTIFVDNVPRQAITIQEKPYTGEQFKRNAFRHEIQMPDDMIPDIWKDQYEETCGLYMAESAIPNSGLGMFTAKEIPCNGQIFQGDVVVQVEDVIANIQLSMRERKAVSKKEPDWLMENYYWSSHKTKGEYEAGQIQSIVPGMGMLANSHPGLVNAKMRPPQITNILRRDKDPGAGASSNFHNVRFVANQKIEAGAELFVEYGDEWFDDRYIADTLPLIPLSDDFEAADSRLRKF
jgi:hypothetical protein